MPAHPARPFLILFGFALACLLPTAHIQAAPKLFADERPWLAFDGPLWDLSDDGLPFRLAVVQPATPDPIGKLLRATDQQWTAWVGYARVNDKFTDSGMLRASGGDALLAGFSRQWRWRLPSYTSLAGWHPHLSFEVGVNYADQSLPSDGSHFNFPVVPGLEWTRLDPKDGADASSWIFGIRWFHLSNAHLLERNSGYDGILFRVGRRLDW